MVTRRPKSTSLFQYIGNSAPWHDLSHRLRPRGTRSISSRFHFSLFLPSTPWRLLGPNVNRSTERDFRAWCFQYSRVSRVLISDGERGYPRARRPSRLTPNEVRRNIAYSGRALATSCTVQSVRYCEGWRDAVVLMHLAR